MNLILWLSDGQGFGNVGAWAGEILQEQGGKVQAVSDAFGAIYNEAGLDIKALRKHLKTGGTIDSFPGGSFLNCTHISLSFNPEYGVI